MSEQTEFDYLLNAMEEASHRRYPSRYDYAGKRAALFAHVRRLEADAALLNELREILKAAEVIPATPSDVPGGETRP